MDLTSGTTRYTFDVVEPSQGIELVPVVMGLFGVGEVLAVAERAGGLPQITRFRFRELFPSRAEWRQALPAILRGTGVGFVIGLLPGPGGVLSTFASYGLERRLAKRPEEFGHGAIEGVAGPESANNAASSAAMVPLLALGIPFSPITAILLAALLIQGVQPGPLLMQQRPDIFWGVVASMYVGNVVLLILNFPLVGIWVSVLRIPQSILVALILMFTLVGAYSINNSPLDLIVLVVMGVVGYLGKKLEFDLSPMVLGLVLGGMLEKTFQQSLYMSRGDVLAFFTRPISGTLLAVLVAILVVPPVARYVGRRRRSAALLDT
jgi:putative tricarboxylic transport membrane protein